MKKVYEGTLVVSTDEKYLLPAKGGVISDYIQKKGKIMYRKITPNYAEEIVTNIRFPLVSFIGNSGRSFYNNDSYQEAKAAILMEEEDAVSEEKVKMYINQIVENYNDNYLQLKALEDQNQKIQDVIFSQVKYGASLVKRCFKECIEDKKEKIKLKGSSL